MSENCPRTIRVTVPWSANIRKLAKDHTIYLSSPPVFSGGSCYYICSCGCMFCRSLFVLLSFLLWSLCCLFFTDLRMLIIRLVSSNSYEMDTRICWWTYFSHWREIINWLLLLIFPFNSFGFHGYTQVKINQDGFNKTGILILLLIISISIYSGIVLVKHQNFIKMQ